MATKKEKKEEAIVEAKVPMTGAMAKYFEESKNPPELGEVVEGKVLSIEKARVYVDLAPFGTGLIYGKEFITARDVIKKLNVGDAVSAKVVDIANKEGYIELSLKEARQAQIWDEAEKAIAGKTVFELPIAEANKGGLIIVWQGISGFLPASQLKSEHYPKIEDGDKDKILDELKKLVGQKLSVGIITADPKEGKLIFSEKNLEKREKQKMADKYKVGDVLEGTVTGTVDFGVFVKLEDGLEGLVHISEIDWGLVDDPRARYKIGDKVDVKVIDVKEGKVSLSIKALKPNPWVEAEKKYKKGDEVSAVVIKFNKYGALASIEEGVSGLVHVSDFGSETKMKEAISLGKSYTFKINVFEPKSQKMGLSFVK
ncbi:MAG: S1 RNA-binding domain-containing protein [Patescibacteria group bacterium]|nr:S1 RNA-binding domain-containing protein [Patescibacteria group bacterium]MDE1946053.1 S1 RNA-binding domain-containing protein [Patescibacteria group bacterium]